MSVPDQILSLKMYVFCYGIDHRRTCQISQQQNQFSNTSVRVMVCIVTTAPWLQCCLLSCSAPPSSWSVSVTSNIAVSLVKHWSHVTVYYALIGQLSGNAALWLVREVRWQDCSGVQYLWPAPAVSVMLIWLTMNVTLIHMLYQDFSRPDPCPPWLINNNDCWKSGSELWFD